MRHPEMKWAQRSNKVFLTIELPDAKNPVVKLEPEGRLKFSATAGDQKYEAELELYKEVNVEASKISIGSREIFIVIEKTEEAWWPRLVKPDGRAPPYLKVDWNKWVDEDEEETKMDDLDLGMGDFSNFANEPDSDDEVDPEVLPDAGKQEPEVQMKETEAPAEQPTTT